MRKYAKIRLIISILLIALGLYIFQISEDQQLVKKPEIPEDKPQNIEIIAQNLDIPWESPF